jgi:hypothetical protein
VSVHPLEKKEKKKKRKEKKRKEKKRKEKPAMPNTRRECAPTFHARVAPSPSLPPSLPRPLPPFQKLLPHDSASEPKNSEKSVP